MKNDRRILAMILASSFLFVILAILVKLGVTQGFDNKLSAIYTPIESKTLFIISMFLHYGFGTESLLVASMVLFSYLIYKKRKVEAYMLATGMLLDVIVVYGMKHLIARSRPLFDMIIESGFSFPSGHTTASMVFFGILAMILFTKYKKIDTRAKIEIGFGLLIGLVGFSRIYLGVHYFTDVFGGFLLGTAILSLVVYIFKKQNVFFSVIGK